MPGVFGNMRDWLRGSTPQRTPIARLAVFGKHPGWNDHIDDIGLETPALVAVRRVLYAEGVAGNIDSGYWARLDPEHRLTQFGHFFLWQLGEATLVGRIWPTSDGKGRTQFPMVACAQFEGVPAAIAATIGWPVLESVQADCSSTSDPAVVHRLAAEAREKLQHALDTHIAAHQSPAEATQELMHSDLLADHGLQRIMYRLDPNRSGKLDNAHLEVRVPSIGRGASSVTTWAMFLSLWGGMPSRIFILEIEHGWIDILLGEVPPSAFSCLLRSPASLPLVSEIPYSLDPAFVTWADYALENAVR